jgi:signal transduction histidine kinase/CheY-like chemotaxis protein
MVISKECIGQRVYETRKIPVIKDGRVASVAGIIRDITEQEQLQKQLQQAHKLEAVGTMAGGVAHDFNNILSIILGNAEIALDDTPKLNPAHYSLKNIKEASLRAAGIVSQLLSFSYKNEPTLKPIEIMAVVRDSIKFLRSTIPTTIEIRKNIPDTNEVILGDPIQINQIMMNLCVNASHEMEDTGGVLTVSAKKITLSEKEAMNYPDLTGGDYIALTVSDTGRGINPRIIDKIFDPYFTTKEFGRGSGMGLSVVHGIVKNHNGSITVDSNPGKGASFRILLPVIDQKYHPEIGSEDQLPSGTETILLVDDEELILNVTDRMLRRFGYHVEAQNSAQEALALFQVKPDRFDLVITDMTMPQMTGVQLSAKLLEIRPDIPIIICTGHNPLVDEEKATAMGIAAYIMKPVEKKVIAQTIRNVLDNKTVKSDFNDP